MTMTPQIVSKVVHSLIYDIYQRDIYNKPEMLALSVRIIRLMGVPGFN